MDDSVFAIDLPLQLSRDQNDVCSKVAMLRRATMHINSAHLNQMLTNMEILAFGIGLFGQVWDFYSYFLVRVLMINPSHKRTTSRAMLTGSPI